MRKIRKFGENILRKKAEEVRNIDDKILRIIKSMKETLISVNGIGLAANQIGILKRIFIAYDKEKENLITVINPEIVDAKEIEIDLEGCLSFPEIYFSISRNKVVTVKGINENGKEIIIEGKDLLARCFQHEIDHLNGILIIDYASEQEKKYYQEKLEQLTSKI